MVRGDRAGTRSCLARRDKRLNGVKFSRPIIAGPCIPDLRARLHQRVVEVDGDTRTDQSRDDRRTEWLEAQGYRVVRVTNADVMMTLDGVLYAIGAAFGAAPLSIPSRIGGGFQ